MGDVTLRTTRDRQPRRSPDGAQGRMQLVRLLDCDRPLAPSSRHDLHDLDEVEIGRGTGDARRDPDARRLRLDLPDPRVSAQHARLVRDGDRWRLEDRGSTNGVRLRGMPVVSTPVRDGDVFELGRTFFRMGEAALPADAPLDVRADELAPADPDLATFSSELAREYAGLQAVAAAPLPVLLLGETGTGKEVVARALHRLSSRPGDLVAVNCGGLADSLIPSELFGHRRGAFSGAVSDRPGLVRSADRGTLFLDEIGELPAAHQTAFLRVLQEQEVTPVGDARPIKVDFRLIAATHRDLHLMISEGSFRADLLGRMTGLVVNLPPLRRRREDLGILIAALIRRAPGGDRLRFHPLAVQVLLAHDWPLNVRELERCLSTAAALSTDGRIERDHVLAALRGPRVTGAVPAERSSPRLRASVEPDPTDAALRQRLEQLLSAHDGNVAEVARRMGKGRMQIHRWARRFGLDLGGFRRRPT